MSSLSDLYIKKETLETILAVLNKKGDKGVAITISINDETNTYGQNISAFVSQSKEDRDAKKAKFYVGNGKTFWTDGKISVADKKQADTATGVQDAEYVDDLPF